MTRGQAEKAAAASARGSLVACDVWRYGDTDSDVFYPAFFLFFNRRSEVRKDDSIVQGRSGNTARGDDRSAKSGVFRRTDGKGRRRVEEVAKNLKNYLKSQGLDKGVEVRIDQKGVTISFSEHVLFDSGSAEMKPEGKRVLTKVAEFIREVVPALSVEGHTDNIPLRGGIYRDNWGLSASRAASVATYLQDRAGFEPQKLQAVGYASTRPIVPNDTPEHMALNRRVDLVILSSFPKR